MSFQIPANLARKLISDPVMAASVIMGADLDTFQKARFRTAWFTPWFMDHSGVSTGKTDVDAFLLAFLRAILLPNPPGYVPRIISVYYQSKGTAQETFLPKIEKYCERSKIFEMQLKVQHGRKFYREMEGCFLIEGRAGWKVELPAGNFMQDAKSQASKRFNDLIIDETGEIDKMGKGINKQLLQRNTLECWNPNHPVFCNHTVFLGHAEDPSHPYYKRYTKMRKAIRRGSQNHATITSSYRDYRGEHHRRYGQDIAKKAEDQRAGDLDEAEAAQVLDGLWERGSKGWYSSKIRESIERLDLGVQLRRADDATIYTLGADFAEGMGGKSDFNSGTVTAASLIRPDSIPDDFDRVGIHEVGGQLWFVRPVFGYFIHDDNVDVLSGVIHRLHLLFGFASIVLDPRGGGASVYKKLVESTQFIDNKRQETRGLCTPADQSSWPEADPIVSFFQRGDPAMRRLFGERYVADNSGPNDYAHTTLLAAMRRGGFAWPAGRETRGAYGVAAMSPEEVTVLDTLSKILNQFGNIGVKVGKDNQPVLSENGFKRFVKNGKTDGAMGALYSYFGMRSTLEGRPAGRQPQGTVMAVFA